MHAVRPINRHLDYVRPEKCRYTSEQQWKMYLPNCVAESHKENSQPDVQGVEDDGAKQASLLQTRRSVSSPVGQSAGQKSNEAVAAGPVKRPSIFGSVALLAESSSTLSASDSVRHRLPSSPFAVAGRDVESSAFVTPPYTPHSRSQPAAATPLAAPHHHHQQQPLPPLADDLSTSLMTPPSVMTLSDRHQHQRGLQTTYTPPFTPLRPATATPVGRPRSRLSLNCPSPLQDLTRPPSTSLTLVSGVTWVHCSHSWRNLLKAVIRQTINSCI